jgi:signal transduction histidine kinase
VDGREVLERIKTDRDFRQIPVVVLTSAQAELDILKSYSIGASCYIIKPVDPKLFSQVINQIQDFWGSVVQLPKYELVEKYKSSSNVQTNGQVPLSLLNQKMKDPVQVLYTEDLDADFESVFQDLAQLSEPRFTLHREKRLADSFKYLENNAVDVVLLDLALPDSEGFETVLRFHAHFPMLPLVVLTGGEAKAQGIRAVKEGADDYLVKGQVQSELLGRTLLHAIERKSRSLAQLDLLARERDARGEAEKAAGIRDEFLSIAGHELRNPLTALKMQMQLVIKTLHRAEQSSPVNELVKTLADKADGQIDRFGKLIDTLLNFSQIQSGRLKLDYSHFEFNQIIRDTLERFTPELKSAQCEIILNLGGPVEGEWDLLRIEQVLINLLSNGIKYAPGKPITVTVTSDPDSVWVRVNDQGPGIPPQDRERIFQRFERARDTHSIPGLGLGLYVVRQIIDTHGGTILVSSEVGAGSTFTVCLPRKARKIPPEFLR